MKHLKNKPIAISLLSLLSITSSNTYAGALTKPIFDNPIALTGANRWSAGQGDKFLYSNVYVGTDAIITVEHVPSGESIIDFDLTSSGDRNNFQPQIDHAGKSVLFSIAFVNSGTNTGAVNASFCFTSIDIDNYEFIGFADAADSYYIDPAVSILSSYAGTGAGYTNGYMAYHANLAGVAIENTSTASAYYASTNKVYFRLGSEYWPSSYNGGDYIKSMHSVTFSACEELGVPLIAQPALPILDYGTQGRFNFKEVNK